MMRILTAVAGAALAAFCVWLMEHPRCKFVMTTFDPGTSRAK